MKGFLTRRLRSLSRRAVPLLALALLFPACQAQEPPLSPAAASFKKEIQDCLDRLTAPLIEPVVKRDQTGMNEALKKTEPDAVKLCRMCPFRIAVLDPTGHALTVYPFKADAVADFSNYELVQKVMKTRVVCQKRFFLQDGSQIYIICSPLKRQDELVGILAVSLKADEAQKRWGLTEQEFLTIDFNR
jgi:hypothetical protein